jgi:membrane protein
MHNLLSILKKTAQGWIDHDAPSKGAAISYYAVLSMAPLVVIAVAVAGTIFGTDAARGQVVYDVQDMVGDAGAQVIQNILENASRPGTGLAAAIIGVITLLFGASGIFSELQTALNQIWDVPKDRMPTGIVGTLKVYGLSFLLILAVGFLLLLSLLVSTFLELFEHWLQGLLPLLDVYAQIFNFLLSFFVIAFLFALIYKVVPATRIRWRDVWFGSLTTALLFTLGKYALAVYIAKMGIGGAYGAAGSTIVLLVWVYYSAQIFLFGAEFTHIYAQTSERNRANRTTARPG